ncbi:LysR family transcriptional regulator [Pseudohalocynthiibacter aestuariivivens]|uniref:LysR family transcriptional regulator n=1 Tax=Roseovarius pelagicus TaxID=2980108 RepID=A0ABY6DBA5_9RHOB|nr:MULTISPECIES: LysR family transcriptional regulator [Rhodobacterales]QIE44808.1 LysR family transcriptional regulator [Pseudohalocynthiibacter aestuariivivens]UXX83284.1 LysR family transcriptional regulator [Roseovarius pelagicus]
MRNLDMTTLRSFVAVSDHGGVTRAAAALNLTQSAVSMQLKRLEELLGIDLMDRSNRKIALTGAGDQLLTYARRLVAMNDEVVGRLTDQVWEGEISLGVPHDIIYPSIPRVLKQFNAAFPRVRVHLTSSYSTNLIELYGRGEIDLILTTESVVGPGGETLIEMPLKWYGAPGGEVWKQRPLPIAHCRNCLFRPGVIKHLDAVGIDWDQAIDSDSDGAIEATVSADLAVTVGLEGSAPRHFDPVPHQGALPDLGKQKINLYGARTPRDTLVEQLAIMVRSGFASPAAKAVSSG